MRPDIEKIKARWDSIAGLTESGDSILFPDSTQAQVLCEDLEAMLAYIASLEAALPRTADGEVIVPGKKLWGRMDSDDGEWYERGSLKRGFRVPMERDDIAVFVSDHGWEYECSPREVFATHPDTGERA